jgi:carboxylesterase
LLSAIEPSDFVDISQRPASQPRTIEGEPPTVLCLHGFTGVPGEVDIGLDVAKSLGLRAHAPLLAGHGLDARALSATRYEDWLASGRDAFEAARTCGRVILVGQSLGSLIATELTLGAPGAVAGLVLMANPFWLKSPHPGLSLRVASTLGVRDFFVPKKGPDLGDPEAYRTHVTYDAQPAHAAMSLEAAGRRLRQELFRLHRPTLILHGARDRVCPVKNAWKVAERVGTSDVRVVVFPRSHHILARDRDRESVKDEIRTFIQRVRTWQP